MGRWVWVVADLGRLTFVFYMGIKGGECWMMLGFEWGTAIVSLRI